MAWSVIRKATEDDYAALEKAQARFERRHQCTAEQIERAYDRCLHYGSDGAYLCARDTSRNGRAVSRGEVLSLMRLWRRVMRRALGSTRADGIAWGTIGVHVD